MANWLQVGDADGKFEFMTLSDRYVLEGHRQDDGQWSCKVARYAGVVAVADAPPPPVPPAKECTVATFLADSPEHAKELAEDAMVQP